MSASEDRDDPEIGEKWESEQRANALLYLATQRHGVIVLTASGLVL